MPAEHPLLKAARALEIRLRKTEIEQELARQYATEQSRLQTLRKDVESAQEAVRSAQKDLESLNQQIEQAKQTRASFDDLEGLIQKRLAPLREDLCVCLLNCNYQRHCHQHFFSLSLVYPLIIPGQLKTLQYTSKTVFLEVIRQSLLILIEPCGEMLQSSVEPRAKVPKYVLPLYLLA